MQIKPTITIGQKVVNTITPIFTNIVSGDVYPFDCRPLDSMAEDVVVAVTTASADQIQLGRVRINVYVADIDNNSGRVVPDIERLEQLSQYADQMVDALNASDFDFIFSLYDAPKVIADEPIKQHFVNYDLTFKIKTF